jgi:hypothetical protein
VLLPNVGCSFNCKGPSTTDREIEVGILSGLPILLPWSNAQDISILTRKFRLNSEWEYHYYVAMPMATREAQREYQRAWCARRRSSYFSGKTCVDCGSPDNLQLDHIDRTTKVDHRVWSWSEQRRAEELKKCVPRCQPCHAKKTNRELGYDHTVHGTESRGYKRGCHCVECLRAHREYQRPIKQAWRRERRDQGLPYT